MEISEGFRRQTGVRRLIEFLTLHRLPAELGVRLYRSYGELAVDAIQEDPYLLTEPCYGADFAAVDAFAMELDVAADDERRVEAGILFELSYNLTNGHTFLPKAKLVPATAALLSLEQELIEQGVQRLDEQGRMRRRYGILIGLNTAEEVKITIGCVYDRPEESVMTVKGRDLKTGLPKEQIVSSAELIEAFKRPARQIVDEVLSVMLAHTHGFDHNFCLNGTGLRTVAHAYSPETGIALAMETTQPGLQLYTGNWIAEGLAGKDGKQYGPHGAFCLEAQFYPDAVHHGNFQSPILKAGDTARQTTIYRFSDREE